MDTLKTKTKTLDRKKGSGLIFAVILMFVILAMVITLSSITVLETKMSQKSKSSVGAFFNAQSGVEWALNKISTTGGSNIITAFPNFSATDKKVPCPAGYGCDVYFLDSSGLVISADAPLSNVAAVRSVGTNNIGGAPDTQRAIEAAVAAGGGSCYTDYSLATSLSIGSSCKISGFTVKGSLGIWGSCDIGTTYAHFRPPGAGCLGGTVSQSIGEAYLCCM